MHTMSTTRKPATEKRTIVFDAPLLERLDALAAKERRSRSNLVRIIIERELEKHERRQVSR